MGCSPSNGCYRIRCTPTGGHRPALERPPALDSPFEPCQIRHASEPCSTAPKVLNHEGTRAAACESSPRSTAADRRCYHTAVTRRWCGWMLRRCGWTYRTLSVFSDDSCGGMLPVKRLLPNWLHTSGGRRPVPDTACERAVQNYPNGAPVLQRGRTGMSNGRTYR
jgi:hypothetical protein